MRHNILIHIFIIVAVVAVMVAARGGRGGGGGGGRGGGGRSRGSSGGSWGRKSSSSSSAYHYRNRNHYTGVYVGSGMGHHTLHGKSGIDGDLLSSEEVAQRALQKAEVAKKAKRKHMLEALYSKSDEICGKWKI